MNNILQGFNSADVCVVGVDGKGEVVFVNTAAKRLCKRDYTGKHVSDMLGEDLPGVISAARQGVLMQNVDFFDRICTLEILPGEPTLLVFKPHDSVQTDIIEALSVFSSNLRSALSDSFAAAQLLKPESDSGYFDILERSLFRLLRPIDAAAQLASFASPDFVGVFNEASLTDCIDRILRDVIPVYDALGLKLVFEPDAAIYTAFDAAIIERSLLALLSNAAKHSPPGGTVTVRARQDSLFCYISVADQGEGIDRDRLSGLFEVSRDERLSEAGRGLGLAIVGEAARLHGGHVTVSAVEPKGAEVVIGIQKRSGHTVVRQRTIRVTQFDPLLLEMCELLDTQTFTKLKKSRLDKLS